MDENKKNNSILNAKLNIPTIIATAFAAIPAALAAEGSDMVTKTFGFIADFINVGVSDIAHSVSYNLFFPVIFGLMNKKHYSKNGKFQFSILFYDLVFKMMPAGWTMAAIFFHIPRNIIQFWLIKNNFDPWASSIIADAITLVIYLPVRNFALKYIEIFIELINKIKIFLKNKH